MVFMTRGNVCYPNDLEVYLERHRNETCDLLECRCKQPSISAHGIGITAMARTVATVTLHAGSLSGR